MTAAGNEAETAHPVQEDFDFLIYPLYCRDLFEGYCFFLFQFYFGFRK